MDDGRVALKMTCGTCAYISNEDIDDGYVCVNPNSQYVTEWRGDDDYCEEWEE